MQNLLQEKVDAVLILVQKRIKVFTKKGKAFGMKHIKVKRHSESFFGNQLFQIDMIRKRTEPNKMPLLVVILIMNFIERLRFEYPSR